MALDDVKHVEAVTIIRRLSAPEPDPLAIAAAAVWLDENHPPPEAYSAAMRHLAEEAS